jgi:predicted HicB family RNase H-like nuclease
MRFIVRAVLSRSVHRQVKDAAKAKGWSVSAWLRYVITQALTTQGETTNGD